MLKLFRVNEDKCSACGKCVQVCEKGVFEMIEVDGKISSFLAHPELCNNCGICFSECSESGTPIEVRASDDKELHKVKYIDVSKCQGCEKCTIVCPMNNFEMTEIDGKIVSKIKDPSKCLADGHCTFSCQADCKAQVTDDEEVIIEN